MKNILNLLLPTLCLTLIACNAGTKFARLDDISIQDNKITNVDIKTQEMLSRGDISGLLFLKNSFSLQETEEIVKTSRDDANINKKYCIYGVSYFMFLTLNPWDVRFTDKQKLQRVLKYAKKQNITGSTMSDIVYESSWFGTPLISGNCVRIYGNINNNTPQKRMLTKDQQEMLKLTHREKEQYLKKKEHDRIMNLSPENREKERENCLNISDNARKGCTYKSVLITNKPFDQYNTEQCLKRHKEFLQSFCAKKYATPTPEELERLKNEKK